MGTTNDIDQAIAALTAMAEERRPDQPLLPKFVDLYYRELPDDDIDDRPLDEAYAAAVTHFELGRRRAPGDVVVNVRTPHLERDGWAPNRTVLMVVSDDVPFLVDTIRMVLDRHRLGIHLLVHPMMLVQRDAANDIVGIDDLGAAPDPSASTSQEAWTQIQVDRSTPELEAVLEGDVRTAIADVMQVVEDFPEMRDRLRMLAAHPDTHDDLLMWLADQHFVFLGAASYHRTVSAGGPPELTLIEGSELGEYRPGATLDATAVWPPSKPDSEADGILGGVPSESIVIARTVALATIHRAARMTSVAVRIAGDGPDAGVVEHRFIGLLGSGAYRESVFAIPKIGERATQVLELSGTAAVSHTGRAIKNVVETLPRDIVFELDRDALAQLVIDIVGLQERRIVRVFDVAEPVGGLTTVFVYLPRARFEVGLENRVAELVGRHYDSEVTDIGTLVEASSLARISMTVRASAHVDLDRLAEQIDRATASWDDRAGQH